MARRAQPVSPALGLCAAALVAALLLGALLATILRAEGWNLLGPADWSAVRFTVLQAALSALISVLLAIPVARALARRRFPGRGLVVTLLGAPFLLPAIVAVLGLLTVFGRAGWVSQLLATLGQDPIHIYGLHGVVFAHVFFNLPLATRLILQGWQDIPAERFRLAIHLGASPLGFFRLVEGPMLRRIVPSALAVIFAICLTSFAVALTLGGGPRATTIELAIYQAFRFDFDLGRAALLAVLQIFVTMTAGMVAISFGMSSTSAPGLDRPGLRWPKARGQVALDSIWIVLATAFLIAPLLAIVWRGLPGLTDLPLSVFKAAAASLGIALLSTAVALALAIPLALSAATGRARLAEAAGLLSLAVSPLVIGTGLFLLLRPLANPGDLAIPVTAGVNAIMSLPFCLRILAPRAIEIVADHGRLGLALNMSGWSFWRLILWRRMRPQIGFAAGIAAALSIGDLGVIALFANPDFATLPLQVFRLMGTYQMEAAAGASLLLFVLSLGLFSLFDIGGRWRAGT